MKYKVYLAGPDVFKPNAKELGASIVSLISHWDIEGMYPLDNEIQLSGDKISNGRQIALANVELIKKCDAVIANLEPFRGPSADIGTVWECAYAHALGKPVWGYNVNIHTSYENKVLGKIPHDGMLIENFGMWDNIMLVYGIDGVCQDIRVAISELKKYLDSKNTKTS